MDSLSLRIRIYPILVMHQPDSFMRRFQQLRASRAPGGTLALTLAPFLTRLGPHIPVIRRWSHPILGLLPGL
jgi:hypothetical protein